MGWCSFKLNEPIKNWFKSQWEWNGNYSVLDSALVKRRTLYGAVKNNETGDVFCAVYLVRWSNEYLYFSYKDMTEHVNPYQYDCPKKIFKLLTPLNDQNDVNGWGREWRKGVEEIYALRDSLKGNLILKLKNPIKFTTGSYYSVFQKIGKKLYAGQLEGNKFNPYVRVKMLDFTKYEFEII